MRLSEKAYDFFGQTENAEDTKEVRRVLENKSRREKRKEIEEILEKTEKITGLPVVFDEVKYTGNLKGKNIAKTSGRYRTRVTVDDTFYGFPEALQIMVAAHENVHALDRKRRLKAALKSEYDAGKTASKLKSYMKGNWHEREAATHLLATKTLGNNYFMDFRSGVDVESFDKEMKQKGYSLGKLKEKGKGMATTVYTRNGMFMLSDQYNAEKSWEGKPSRNQVKESEHWDLQDGGQPLNDSLMLDYDVVEGGTISGYDH